MLSEFKPQPLAVNLVLALLPIAVSLGLTALVVIAVGSDPREVLETVVEGAFRNNRSTAGVVNYWIPLTLACLGLVVTFTAGLWNIGVEGQMAMGAIFASWPALFLDLPHVASVGLSLLLAMLGGALWALVVGVLKTRLGVHEIFGGVALNALASVATIYLISGPWQPDIGGSAQSTEPFPEAALLPELSRDFPVNPFMIGVVLVAALVVVLALWGTRWGLQLKATGKNPKSALLLGVPTERTVLSAFIACGVLAGLAGAYRVLFTYDSLRPQATGGIGFLGLLVVLLVSVRALWVPLIAFVMAALAVGSTRLRLTLQLDQSLAGVVQGIIVLAVVLFDGVRDRLRGREGHATTKILE